MNNSNEDSKSGSNAHSAIQDLIDRGRGGDSAALSELFQHCQDYLLFIANHQLDSDLKSKLGASDIVQQTLMVAHRKFQQFQGSTREDLLAWLRGILANDLRQTRRHYKKVDKRQIEREDKANAATGFPETADSIYTPGTQASIAEESKRLNAAIAGMSQQYQAVLRMRNWQQLSFAEIGATIGKSADAARKIWTRAVIELESRLNRLDP